MFKNKLNYRLINLLLLFAIIYILYLTSNKWGYVIGKILDVSFPFIIGFVFAYVLNPFVKYLEGKGVRRNLAIFAVVLLILGTFIGILCITLPLVYDQLLLFSKTLINILVDISTKFDINMGEFSDTIMGTLNNIITGVGNYLSNGTITFVNKGLKILTNLIIIIVVGTYLLIDMDMIKNNIKNRLLKYNKREYKYVKKLDLEVGNYFHGLIIFMIIQLFEYSILFRLVNHPNWLILGVLASITTIIPYFGGYITNIIAVITASTISTPVFIGTLIICFIFPNIDGYIISPKIYGKTNRTNPVIAIFIMAVLSSLFGFIGIVIAMPLYIFIKCTYEFYRKDIKKVIKKHKKAFI